MLDKRQLLCTFSNVSNLKITADELQNFYKICNNTIFVFYNEKNDKELFLTYNILNENNSYLKFPNTISIHRKKQTNTLYSINSLNILIKDENGGVLDKSYKVNWELYSNSFIITGDVSVRIIPIKLLNIINNF
jgi:hypothetical protein